MLGCQDAGMRGCRDVGIPGCRDAGMRGAVKGNAELLHFRKGHQEMCWWPVELRWSQGGAWWSLWVLFQYDGQLLLSAWHNLDSSEKRVSGRDCLYQVSLCTYLGWGGGVDCTNSLGRDSSRIWVLDFTKWGEVDHQNTCISLFSLLLIAGVISCLQLLPWRPCSDRPEPGIR